MKTESRGSIRISQSLAEAIKDAQSEAWTLDRVRVSQSDLLERAWAAYSGNPVVVEAHPGATESRSLSQLTQLRALLGEALALIDGVQSDGKCVADEIGEIERTLADSGHPGNPRQDAAPHGVRQKPGRRAQ